MAYLYRKFIKDEFYILNMPRKKKKEFKWFPEHPCKVCGRLIPEPMTYCSSKCRNIDKKGMHVHLAYFGSELACPECNPNCHQNHGIGKIQFCGDENCPMNPKRFQKQTFIKDECNSNR
jgi:hypothetical protein